MKNTSKYKKEKREISAVSGAEATELFTVEQIGSTLNRIRIFHGDKLIVKRCSEFNETNLYVFDTPDGKTAKFAFEFFGDIFLHNNLKWSFNYKAEEVKVLGVVVRVERDLEVKQ